MTREEAKEKLYMEWQKFLEDNIDYSGISEAYKMAIEALELVTSYEGTINKLTEALNQQKEGHWIPVSERLPEDPDPYTDELPQTVLVWEKHYSYKAEDFIEEFNIGWCWKGNWSVLGGGIVKVLAWMPLPKPYEPQERSDKEC